MLFVIWTCTDAFPQQVGKWLSNKYSFLFPWCAGPCHGFCNLCLFTAPQCEPFSAVYYSWCHKWTSANVGNWIMELILLDLKVAAAMG